MVEGWPPLSSMKYSSYKNIGFALYVSYTISGQSLKGYHRASDSESEVTKDRKKLS
ncbi:unnamed protein product [Sphenostylis stenocarpa]|uniref:Uncharacterized protein n=1 Tax=Sphenostylis stenocarpa TaxID=92480 RepID=A0AA87B9H0_9FABA|nr:unnamed protein product [Sphenostylis stenocarpa]